MHGQACVDTVAAHNPTAPMTESSPGISNLWSHCLHRVPGATLSRTVLQGDPFSQPNPTAHVCTVSHVYEYMPKRGGEGGREGGRGSPRKDLLEERQAWSYRKLAASHPCLFP